MRDATSPHRDLLLSLFQQALAAVDGRRAVAAWLQAHPTATPSHLVALGKAAASMAAGALEAAGDSFRAGLVVSRYGYLEGEALRDPRFVALEAGHPLPDEQSLAAGRALLLFLQEAPAEAEFLFLISGGTSSIVEVPVPGMSLEQLRQLNLWLLGSGLPIADINRVRSTLSCIKGGRLGAALSGRRARLLLMSDVPGDVAADIGSGLLLPATPTPLPELPARFRELPFMTAPMPVTPGIEHTIVASNSLARAAVVQAAQEAGVRAWDEGDFPVQDAAACGTAIADFLSNAGPGIHVWGGETTVRLPPYAGQGGRNQHLVLAAATALAGRRDIHLLSVGTDGSDGVTDDAGGLVDGSSLERGADAGYDAQDCLKRAASAEFLEASGDLIHTGFTGCNVMDLVIGYKHPDGT